MARNDYFVQFLLFKCAFSFNNKNYVEKTVVRYLMFNIFPHKFWHNLRRNFSIYIL